MIAALREHPCGCFYERGNEGVRVHQSEKEVLESARDEERYVCMCDAASFATSLKTVSGRE